MADKNITDRWARTEWFRAARFGMFIHWGLYAIPSRGEWIRSIEKISKEDYQKFFDEFKAEEYNPKEWAALAKKAGMKYAILTAKHHDGFCLWDTKLTDYKSTKTKAGRDLVREFLDAFRAEGIKAGLYYSVVDWHHDDYPHYKDAYHPMRDNEKCGNEGRDFNRYVEYLHGQVRELLTDYGRIDIMWYDFSYGEMAGAKWKSRELVDMARKLQPHLIIDNRLEGSGEESGTILTNHPSDFAGDFACPEQMVPPQGIVNESGESVPWESCLTLNCNWGYCAADQHWKPADMVIRTLVECVSKNGNLLLNIGPDSKGIIPQASVKILEEVGRWMKKNSPSIYGCGKADFPKPEWGRYTQNGKKLYAHIFEPQAGAISLMNMDGKLDKARLLSDGSEVRIPKKEWNLSEYKEHEFLYLKPGHGNNYPLPDKLDTVVEITLK